MPWGTTIRNIINIPWASTRKKNSWLQSPTEPNSVSVTSAKTKNHSKKQLSRISLSSEIRPKTIRECLLEKNPKPPWTPSSILLWIWTETEISWSMSCLPLTPFLQNKEVLWEQFLQDLKTASILVFLPNSKASVHLMTIERWRF